MKKVNLLDHGSCIQHILLLEVLRSSIREQANVVHLVIQISMVLMLIMIMIVVLILMIILYMKIVYMIIT